MRIISSFYDYYDCMQGFGGYDATQYIRETQIIAPNNYTKKTPKFGSWGEYTLVFCSEVFRINALTESMYDIPIFCYSLEEVDNYYLQQDKKTQERYFNRTKTYWYWSNATRNSFVRKYSEESVRERSIYSKWNDKYKAPIVVEFEGHIYINPCLKTLNFFRIKDIYTTYQAINMWISNQAMPEKPIPYIDDKTMAEAKGFDKYSFRKDKQK